MKPVDSNMDALLPVLERIAGALERIGQSSDSFEKISGALDRLEAVAKRYERLQRIAIWNERFSTLETIITPDKLETMKTMIDEFVWKEYREQQFRALGTDGFELWLRKILTIQRIYEYMMMTTHLGEWPETIRTGKSRPKRATKDLQDEDYAVVKWLRELVQVEDFRMVHYRQGAFYPNFSRLVNAVLLEMADRYSEDGDSTNAEILKRAATDNGAAVAFDEFTNLPERSTEKQRISEFIRSKGEDPHDFDGFRLIWATYPDWRNSGEHTSKRSNIVNFPDGEPAP